MSRSYSLFHKDQNSEEVSVFTDYLQTMQSLLLNREILLESDKPGNTPVSNPKTAAPVSFPSIVPVWVKTGLSVLGLTSFTSAVSAQNITLHAGIPAGGRDMCEGLKHCVQAYLQENQAVISQFNLLPEVVGGASRESVAQYGSCSNLDSLFGLINHLGVNVTQWMNENQHCYATSFAVNGIDFSSMATRVSDASCDALQEGVQQLIDNCQKEDSSGGMSDALKWGLIAGGIVLGVIGGAGLLKCYLNRAKKEQNNENKSELTAPLV